MIFLSPFEQFLTRALPPRAKHAEKLYLQVFMCILDDAGSSTFSSLINAWKSVAKLYMLFTSKQKNITKTTQLLILSNFVRPIFSSILKFIVNTKWKNTARSYATNPIIILTTRSNYILSFLFFIYSSTVTLFLVLPSDPTTSIKPFFGKSVIIIFKSKLLDKF